MAVSSENGAIVRVEGENYQSREFALSSHPDQGMTLQVIAAKDGGHARIAYRGYWHEASVALELSELAQFRDAINAVLIEAGR